MIPFLADQNFNARIIRGLRRRVEGILIRTAAEAGLSRTTDAAVLAWAAENRFVVVTHDVNTLIAAALARVRAQQPMPGVVIAGQELAIGRAIDDLALIAICGTPEDLQGQIWYLPL